MSQKIRPRHPTEPYFLRHLEIGFAHIEEAANKLNSFVSANVAQIKRLQVVNFVVFCVVLANFLKNPCHNTIFSNMKIKDYSRHRIIPAPAPGMAAQQSAHSKIQSLERPVLAESLQSILRTGRSESAGGRLEWRDAQLIEPYQKYERRNSHLPQGRFELPFPVHFCLATFDSTAPTAL